MQLYTATGNHSTKMRRSRARESTVPSASQSTQSTQRRGPAVTTLPAYEPLAYPLKTEAINSLDKIKRHNEHNTFKYLEEQLNTAIQLLTECAEDINGLANARLEDAKGGTRGSEMTDTEEIQELENNVEKLTTRMAENVRKNIDNMQELVNIKTAMQTVIETSKIPPTHGAADDEEDVDNTVLSQIVAPDPATAPAALFVAQVTSSRDTYQLQSLRMRYSEHPKYVDFKSSVHESKHGVGAEMPHPSTWFPSSRPGSPLPGTQRPGGNDSDDDLQTVRTMMSTKCPLSLKEMEHPMNNRACAHVFEKSSIEGYLQGPVERGRRQIDGKPCPVTGCDKTIRPDQLYVDDTIVRKIRRVQTAKRREVNQAVDLDDEDDEDVDRVGWNDIKEDEDDEEDVLMSDD